MALSGSFNGSVTLNSRYFTFYVTWSATQNIAGNYSDVTVNTYIKTNDTYQTFDTVGARNHSITINGATTSSTKRINCNPWNSNGVYSIQSATTRVNHNSDGTKSITISARSNGLASSWGYSSTDASSGDATASATVTLNTIPRASSISSISNDGMIINGSNALTVNISRASSSFTHDITFTFGSYTGSLTGQGTSGKYVVPLSWVGRFGSGGSGSLKGTVTVQTKSGGTKIGSAVSKEFTLKCPSASTFTLTASNIVCNGTNAIGVNISRSVSSFKHKVVWAWGPYTETKSNIDTSTSYTPQPEWLDAIPSANSGWGTVTVETYYGSQKIGATASARFDMSVPSYSPSLISVSTALVQDSRISDWTIYVQKYSKCKFTFNGAAGAYGSSISKYAVVIDGITYSGTSSNYTSNALNSKGTLNWTATITDSRGKTTSKTGSISVSSLVVPKFGSATVYRYDGSKESITGTQLYFKFNYTYETYNGKNSATNSISIKKDGASGFTKYGTFTNGQADVITDYYFDYMYGYTVRFTATDELGNSVQYDKYIKSASALIDIDGKNNALALLKRATRKNFVQIGGNLEVDGYVSLPNGTYNHFVTGNGIIGYNKFATIKIVNTYSGGCPIVFEMTSRTYAVPTKVIIDFEDADTLDPNISTFQTIINNQTLYIHKSATSTWDLYINNNNNDGWNRFIISNLMSLKMYDVLYQQTTEYFNITWTNEIVTSLPSGYVSSNCVYYLDGTHHRFNNDVAIYGGLELSGDTPYIDFHHGSSTSDYTHRIIADTTNRLYFTTGITVNGNVKANNFGAVQMVHLDYNTNTTQTVYIGGSRSVAKVFIALNGSMGYVEDTLYINSSIVTVKRAGSYTNDSNVKYSWDNTAKTLTVTCGSNWSYGFLLGIIA